MGCHDITLLKLVVLACICATRQHIPDDPLWLWADKELVIEAGRVSRVD